MPIVITTCPKCDRPVEIDTAAAVVLTGNDEMVWREVRRHCRPGSAINVQYIADVSFLAKSTTYGILRRLAALGLIRRTRVRLYYHYYIAASVSDCQKSIRHA